MDTKVIRIDVPEGVNIVLGQSHFIKTVEDLHEAIVCTVPHAKFGIAFNESSGPCLVRVSGNEQELTTLAGKAALQLGAGHSFIVFLKDAYPINVLDKIKAVPEVCSIYAATANPIQVVVAETDQGRGILGVIDGLKPKDIEGPKDVEDRKSLLRKMGYKL
ncbi:MAG: adenosine-specific kinase [Candidatus Bathyarchaeia archaeon]